MSEKIKFPPRELSFTVGENTYKVKYPNNGQLIQIQSLKHSLTGNQYNSISEGRELSDQLAKYSADRDAFLITCCPQMRKDLKVATFAELEAEDSSKLLTVYIKTILPWLNDWENALNRDPEESMESIGESAAE